MKIHTKLILLFVVISLLITLINGLAFIIQGEKFLVQRTKTQLESVAVLKENQLETFIRDAEWRLESMAREKLFVDNFLKLIREQADENRRLTYQAEYRELLNERLASERDFNEIFVLDASGMVCLSTNKASEGQIKSIRPYFTEADKETFVQSFYYSLRLKKLTTVITSPIKDSQGKTVGVLAARVNLDKISDIMLERSGLGETGETYLVNKFNYMVTESRFEKGLALKKTIYNNTIKDCLKGNSGYQIYNGYRDVSVIGVYRWLPETEACLVANIDKEEALKPVKGLMDIMGVVNVTALILTVFLSFFLSKTITDPIGRLVKGTEEIRKGNLNYKLDISSKDEVGWLGESFNEMAESLEKTTVSKDYVDRIIEGMSDFLIVVTPELKINRVNRAVTEFLGYNEAEFFGKSIEEIISLRDLYLTRSELKYQIRKGNLINQEVYYRAKDGKELPVLFSVSLMNNENGVLNCIICTAWDIAKRKLAEEKIKEIAEMKSKLTSTVSHELRTPLAAIKTGINIVLDELSGKLNTEQDELFDIIKRNIERLNRLIDDVLSLQKLESGKMQFRMKKDDINQIVREVYKVMQALTKQKKLQLNLELADHLPEIYLDKDRIVQVLTNLINNAIKFTDRGQIVITTRREGNHIWVMVKDTGIGFRDQDIPKVFESFVQLEAARGRKIEGTGLGLAICKEIIEQHQGKIWVESRLNQGSIFSFTLPIITSPKKI